MDTYNVTGTLYKLFDAEQVTQRFRKRELVLELAGRYPQFVMFQLTGDRCEDADGLTVGDAVHLTFRLKGREWTGSGGNVRYFNSLEIVEISKDRGLEDDNDFGPPGMPQGGAPAPPTGNSPPPDDGDAPWVDPDADDIPF
ncbi:MAG: single-strand DNA-binding protein [Myxococcota bacterium]|jgi:single-strand DNA-binding protein